jgi:hypothetical protein
MVEQHVVNLIQSGEIHGRVDSQNKVCKCRFPSSLYLLFHPAFHFLVYLGLVREEDGLSR